MWIWIGIGFVLVALGWKIRSIFRGPMYVPGSLRKSMEEEEKYTWKNKSTWKMPDNSLIHHFSVKTSNEEGVPVLAVHGGPGLPPHRPWKVAYSKNLENIASFHFYHARGCGKSSRPFQKWPSPRMWPGINEVEKTLGLGANVADVERIRRQLGVDKIHLLGHSFGGFVAVLYASEFPEHVGSLTLVAPASVLKLPRTDMPDLFESVEKKLSPEHLAEFKAFMKRYFDFGSLPTHTEESLAALQDEFTMHYGRTGEYSVEKEEDVDDKGARTGGFCVFAQYLSMGVEHDYRPLLRTLLSGSTFPVAIVHGNQDLQPVEATREYLDLFPKSCECTLYEVDGDHFVCDEQDGKLAEILSQTVSKCQVVL